mmetsp:Transcript_2248/g.4705  ORF Transcript_2248/g.4705 Transcript_2248/m.4705 type:complete len:559 (-) Transcript_2248:172-1848(-)
MRTWVWLVATTAAVGPRRHGVRQHRVEINAHDDYGHTFDADSVVVRMNHLDTSNMTKEDLLNLPTPVGTAAPPAAEPDGPYTIYPEDWYATSVPLTRWAKYAKTRSAEGLQARCLPRVLVPAKEHRAQRRMAMLIHGFTACPSQMGEPAEDLQRQGWYVFLPLHVGMGRAPRVGRNESWDGVDPRHAKVYVDDNTAMPSTPSGYRNFARTLNGIRREFPATEAVVGGLSAGGSMTTAVWLGAPRKWTRVLIMNPAYGVDAGIQQVQLAVAKGMALATFYAASIGVDWGLGCHYDRQAPCFRAGVCYTDTQQVSAMLDFGYQTWQRLFSKEGWRAMGLSEVQMVTTYRDEAINDPRVEKAYHQLKKLSKYSPKSVHFCYLPHNANHAWTNECVPGVGQKNGHPKDMYYWEPIKARVLDFLTGGAVVPTRGKIRTMVDKGYYYRVVGHSFQDWPLCDIGDAVPEQGCRAPKDPFGRPYMFARSPTCDGGIAAKHNETCAIEYRTVLQMDRPLEFTARCNNGVLEKLGNWTMDAVAYAKCIAKGKIRRCRLGSYDPNPDAA